MSWGEFLKWKELIAFDSWIHLQSLRYSSQGMLPGGGNKKEHGGMDVLGLSKKSSA